MSSPRRWILHTIFLLSGAAALAFQMASVRIFAAVLGHELPAALAVVGAFFGGLSVGAWALDRPIARSPRPGIWYAGLEVVIGLWGVACVGLAVPASELALHCWPSRRAKEVAKATSPGNTTTPLCRLSLRIGSVRMPIA